MFYQDLQVIAYWVALNLGFLEHFFFPDPSVLDAFLLSVLYCFLMDDDLEFCLVVELIMLVAEEKKNWHLRILNF
jgi:hypothetical protein